MCYRGPHNFNSNLVITGLAVVTAEILLQEVFTLCNYAKQCIWVLDCNLTLTSCTCYVRAINDLTKCIIMVYDFVAAVPHDKGLPPVYHSPPTV